jgi:hypothetical protein
MQTRNRRPKRTRATWLLTWFMLIALPLYGVSATLVGLLGPVHFHKQAAAVRTVVADSGPMAGWQDFRRVGQVRDASDHSHPGLGRHHHDGRDASAVTAGPDEGDAGLGDGAASNAPTLVFVAVRAAALPGPAMIVLASWPAERAYRIASCDARRLERPPRT